MSDTIEQLYEKLDKNFPEHKDKSQLICTLMGTSANLAEFILDKINLSTIPFHIQYCMLITSVNMMGMIHDDVVFEKVILDDSYDCKLSEQSQEHIYRKMKRAVDLIVESFKKYEAENDI